MFFFILKTNCTILFLKKILLPGASTKYLVFTILVLLTEYFLKYFIQIVGLGQHKDLENTLSTIPELSTIYVPRVTLKKNQFLIPGFIDTHIHAPQYPNAGLGYDEPLLEWLNKYTYNLESKYSDLKFSEKVYNAVVVRTNCQSPHFQNCINV